MTTSESDSNVFEVNEIISHRINREGILEFEINWVGYGPEDNTWEQMDNLNCPGIFKKYVDNIKSSNKKDKKGIEMLIHSKPELIFAVRKDQSGINYKVYFENGEKLEMSSESLKEHAHHLLLDFLESKITFVSK